MNLSYNLYYIGTVKRLSTELENNGTFCEFYSKEQIEGWI